MWTASGSGGPGGIRTRDLPDVWLKLANRTFFGPSDRLVYQTELPAHFLYTLRVDPLTLVGFIQPVKNRR